MLIKTLVENTSISEDFGHEHGLSLYIETMEHRILFDVGASDLFLQNAGNLDVNISEIDYLVISHGHNDHGGGLGTFLKVNTSAEVFLHHLAFEGYYSNRANDKLRYIGLDANLKDNNQIVLTSDRFFISKGIQVISNIEQIEPLPVSNSGLLMEREGQMVDDDFAHEQNLIIEEDGKILLITGCAHNGIINILEHIQSLIGRMPDYVIGGFHLSSRSGRNVDSETIDRLGKYLLGTEAKYYTCHCTGIEAYKRLKPAMGDRLDYLPAGSVIEIH